MVGLTSRCLLPGLTFNNRNANLGTLKCSADFFFIFQTSQKKGMLDAIAGRECLLAALSLVDYMFFNALGFGCISVEVFKVNPSLSNRLYP